MKGKDVVAALRRKFRTKTNRALCEALGITNVTLLSWEGRKKLTARSIADQMCRLASKRASIRPIVEFFPLRKSDSKQGAKQELFQIKDSENQKHPYLSGLRRELEDCHGVYIFFDSRGHAIYTGKARKLNLWREITGAFNRERGELQKIKRVRYPTRKQSYRPSDEKARQIYDYEVPLHDLAYYFSAYEVSDSLIGDIEALLVRAFANDLLNKRMERFGNKQSGKHTRNKKRRKARRRRKA